MVRPRRAPQPGVRHERLVEQGVSRERALLAERVSSLRLLRNWSWYEAATAADLKDVQIRAIEEGRRDPEFTTLVRLARAFNLSSLDQLLVPSGLEQHREEQT